MLKSLLFSLVFVIPSVVAMDGSTVLTTTYSQPAQPRMAAEALRTRIDSTETKYEHCCLILSRLLLNGSLVIIESPIIAFDNLKKKNK